MTRNRCAFLIVLLAVLLPTGCSPDLYDSFDRDHSAKTIVKLAGTWRFSVGDAAEWANPEFSDEAWEKVHAPFYWHDEGYDGYHGYAWYRKWFTFPKDTDREKVLLSLGRIDDVDQAFVNGRPVGASGQFPPNYVSASGSDRVYEVPAASLKPGQKNLIAVRVYDGGGRGGIYSGALRLYSSSVPRPAIQLEGTWLFHPGDDTSWKTAQSDDSDLARIQVPARWETQGHEDLDGFAWYQTTFATSSKLTDGTAVLLLGKIDDIDEVYLNGTFVGSTGNMKSLDRDHYQSTSPYAQSRAYSFPASLLRETNTLAIRVYDLGGDGGLYEGPVGIMSQADFAEFWKTKRSKSWGWLKRLLHDE